MVDGFRRVECNLKESFKEMAQHTSREFVTVGDAITLSGLKKSSVYKAISDHNFPAVQDVVMSQRRLKIPTVFLMQWIEQKINERQQRILAEKKKIHHLEVSYKRLKEFYHG